DREARGAHAGAALEGRVRVAREHDDGPVHRHHVLDRLLLVEEQGHEHVADAQPDGDRDPQEGAHPVARLPCSGERWSPSTPERATDRDPSLTRPEPSRSQELQMSSVRRADTEDSVYMNVIPMVDIMFLLLLFFMLTADFGGRELEEV